MEMIEVDISNVWGELALPDLLAMEKSIFDAHLKLMEEDGAVFLPESEEEILRLQKTAEKIRGDSDVCVVIGLEGGCRAARAAMTLLQGEERNLSGGKGAPKIFFAGDSLSTRRWKELTGLLDGRDFSVIVISGAEFATEPAIAFRGLRWMLERKYGTDGANGRIYAVTDPEQDPLGQMAQEAGWQTFVMTGSSGLTAAGLLPMAVAGIDILEVINGAKDAKESYDLRSYENPVWLYAAVRQLLCRSGRKTELLASFASGFRAFGGWWQRLFAGSGGEVFPAAAEYPADRFPLGACSVFETMLHFAPGEEEYVIGSDWKDLDGLNSLAGKTLADVEKQTHFDMVADHADAGIPVITMDCGVLNERTMGELFYFMELSCAISACIQS